MEQYSFIYPISSLREKVEMLTSVMGKHRSAEGAPHLMEQLSMTEGEGFLFDKYLKEAVPKTYNWIKAFGRNLTNAYRIVNTSNVVRVTPEHSANISSNNIILGYNKARANLLPGMYTITDEAGDNKCIVISQPGLRINKGDLTSFSFSVKVGYTTLADGLFADTHEYNEVMYSNTDADISELCIYVSVPQDDFATVISSVDYIEIEILNYNKQTVVYHQGDFIEIVDGEGRTQYGIQQSTDTRIHVTKWFDVDIRNCVMFNIELLDWMDRNVLPSADEYLEDALVNYIIYRWFENVNQKEADTFFAKWEEDAHAAQLALNTERRILQRKSTWL